ncbi:MAG: HAMP domain-containing protein, partial [Chloroflexi bacterium]|nr:HAMP domain-containing protein [Chloroflexota bacterium]MCI0648745.1 HAMP domain-containing protein [Chloroflexota bacterium]
MTRMIFIRSLTPRLVLAFLFVSLISTALVAVFAGRQTTSDFDHFMMAQHQETAASLLAEYYRSSGGWEGVEAILPVGGMMGMGSGPGGGQMMAGMFTLAGPDGRVVAAGMGFRPGERLSSEILENSTPVEADGRVVGWLVSVSNRVRTRAGVAFLTRFRGTLVVGAVGATVVALALGVVLAQTLARPLHELTAATRAVALGELGHQVPVRSDDELGELATSFNQMSADLAQARDLRRQMTA